MTTETSLVVQCGAVMLGMEEHEIAPRTAYETPPQKKNKTKNKKKQAKLELEKAPFLIAWKTLEEWFAYKLKLPYWCIPAVPRLMEACLRVIMDNIDGK